MNSCAEIGAPRGFAIVTSLEPDGNFRWVSEIVERPERKEFHMNFTQKLTLSAAK